MTNTQQPTETKKKGTRFITPILALVATLAVGVFGGIFIGQNTASDEASTSRTGVMPGQGGMASGAGFTRGTVESNDDGTLTITTSDGETVTVTTGSTTTVTTTIDGDVADLAEGDTVTIVGEADSDGAVAATAITEGESGLGGFGGAPGGAGMPTDAPTAAPDTGTTEGE
jgi:uncharacterized protein YaiE (UPF0345 family)